MTINIPPSLYSWKTTLIGVISAIIGVIQASSYHGDWALAIKDRGVQMAIAVAILGFVSKDSNVTGGNSGQPSTPKALHQANQAPSTTNPPAGPVVPPAVPADKI